MSTPTSSGGSAPTDALGQMLRILTFAMLAGVVVITAVTVFTLVDGAGTALDAASMLVVGGVFLAAAWFIPRRVIKPWSRDSSPNPERASGQLRTAAFLTLVFAELPALIGMVNSVAREAWLPVLIGATLSVFGLLAASPNADRLRQWHAHLESDGARTGL